MRRFLFFFLFFSFSFPLFSQLDVLHYIPPLYGRTNVQDHYIIVSTPSALPVSVTIKRGDGSVITTAVVTDVSPATILLGSGYGAPGIIGTAELNTVNSLDGFIVEGSSPIYVNLRHVQSAQGLSLTSKGAQTGLGNHFRSGHIYSNSSIPYVKAHLISVMAVEDGTTVTFSDISPGVIFRGTPVTGSTSDDISVVLNAGQSYTIAAWVDEPGATGNLNDVNGTLITSDKPIACNTGSWLSGGNGGGRDIGVDQLVPLDLVGSEYIIVEGNGNANTERPLVVAEFDGTDIFINGSGVPYATINSGEYLYLPQSTYSVNDNIYINTSQPVFMFQSLSGTNTAATCLNFIPPLRCNGFKKVVIPSVNLVGVATVSITARAMADVFVNGSTIPLTGGLTVPGNSCWLTYEVPGGTGDFFVESDSIINVALLTLQGVRGSAGYFTGFAQFTELDRGDTTSFVVCGEEGSSYVTYSIEGPYLSVETSFYDPSLGGSLVVDDMVGDTLKFTYSRPPGVVGPDTLDILVCKLLECCGALPDTICELSTLVFTNIEDIDVGLGDSISICSDTAAITLPDLILGSPDPGGYWVDADGTGALFGDSFDPSLVAPGTYHFIYFVDGPSICYDSTVVTLTVLPMSSSTCCSISPDIIVTEPTCSGLPNGAFLITDDYATEFSIDGGTTVEPDGDFGGILGGTYDLFLSFGPDCSFDTTITISEPDPLLATITVDSVTCNGACDGAISAITTVGGTAPYVYSLGGGPDQVSPDFNDLCPGSKVLTVTDDNGCEFIIDTTVYEPAILLLTEINVVVESSGLVNGALTVGPIGGTASYSYTLDGGLPQVSPIFSDLSAGTYTIAVTDANGCTDDLEVTVLAAPGPIPFVDVLNDVTCNGGLNGSVIIGILDGTAPFTFSLDGGLPQASNSFPSVGAGSHTVVVTDAFGCTGAIDFDIAEPSPLTFSTTVSDVNCNGACDGEIDIDASGATPPYFYSDDAGVTFSPFDVLDDLCPGDVFVVVQDDNGCLANVVIEITEPDALSASFTTIDPLCNGTPTGEIDVTASGGVLPYSYSTDGGLTYAILDPITAMFGGDYTVIVKDDNGCEFVELITLTDPPPFTFTFVSNDPSNCGASDGSFEMIASGGSAPYTYSIDGGVTTFADGLFDGLFSGLYTLVAEDADGCVDSTLAALSDNIMVGDIIFENPTTCYNGSDGALAVTQIGGAAPFSYTIHTDPSSPQPFGTFAGLEAGTYFVTIEDDGLCLVIVELEITEPDSILFPVTKADITCPLGNDGEINVGAVTGGDGGPYTYSIDGGGSYQASPNFAGLTAGTYTVFVQDGNGCLGSETIILNEPDLFDIYVDATNLLCNGDLTGSIFVVADGANGPAFSYTVGGTTELTGVFTGLAAGLYNITISDGIGCLIDTLVTLTEPDVLTAVYTIDDVSCSDVCDGVIEVVPAGGTFPYVYSSDGGSFLTSAAVLDDLCPGDYDVYLEDDNGCIVLSTETIGEPLPLSLIIASSPETCDSDNGTITITASGGTPAYSFSIDGGATLVAGNIFIDLNSIYYDLYVEDINGCSVDSVFEVLADPLPNIVDVVHVDPLCFGGADGSLTITSDDGVGAHEYSITSAAGPFQASNNFSGLMAGAYTVFVRDANGCVVSLDVVLNEPDALNYLAVITDLSCFENSTGEIEISGIGGTIPYQFSIDGGLSFTGVGNFFDLPAGDYDLVVEDVNGCQITGVETINEPNELIFDPFVITPATCYGVCDGAVNTNVSGGTAPYGYSWSGALAGSGADAVGVCDGTYTVVVNDANGCILDSINFVVTEPIQAIVDSVIITPVTCNGDTDGIIEAYSATAGFFSIGGPFTGTSIYTDLPSAIYWVYVQDANGCAGDSMIAFVPTPSPLIAFVTPDIYICPGDTVYPSVVATGGTAPHVFDWNNGSSSDALIIEPIFSDTMYFATVTDAKGCTYDSDTMYVITAPPPVILASNDTVVCPGSDLILTAIADDLLETYLYLWDIGDTLPMIYPTVNSDTTFYVTVTDECLLETTDSIHVSIFPPPIVSIIPDVVGGCPTFQVNYAIVVDLAEVGSDFLWTTGHGTIDSTSFTNLYITYESVGDGDINLSFTSADGCAIDTTFENLLEFYAPPIAAFSFNPDPPTIYDLDLYLENSSINNDNNYWIMFGDTTETINAAIDLTTINPDSTYTVCLMVTNEFGCLDQVCKQFKVENELFLFVPNTIIIDGDATNAVFKPVTNYFHPDWYSLQIFNRWGELIFETTNVEDGWDGTYVNGFVQDGVYVWKIVGAPFSNEADLREYYGHVNVLR